MASANTDVSGRIKKNMASRGQSKVPALPETRVKNVATKAAAPSASDQFQAGSIDGPTRRSMFAGRGVDPSITNAIKTGTKPKPSVMRTDSKGGESNYTPAIATLYDDPAAVPAMGAPAAIALPKNDIANRFTNVANKAVSGLGFRQVRDGETGKDNIYTNLGNAQLQGELSGMKPGLGTVTADGQSLSVGDKSLSGRVMRSITDRNGKKIGAGIDYQGEAQRQFIKDNNLAVGADGQIIKRPGQTVLNTFDEDGNRIQRTVNFQFNDRAFENDGSDSASEFITSEQIQQQIGKAPDISDRKKYAAWADRAKIIQQSAAQHNANVRQQQTLQTRTDLAQQKGVGSGKMTTVDGLEVTTKDLISMFESEYGDAEARALAEPGTVKSFDQYVAEKLGRQQSAQPQSQYATALSEAQNALKQNPGAKQEIIKRLRAAFPNRFQESDI